MGNPWKNSVIHRRRKIGPVLNFSGGGGENVVLGNKTFPENGRHWVKMVSLKAGDTEVDQLTFEPVN